MSQLKSGIVKCREHLNNAINGMTENLCYLCQEQTKGMICKVCEQDCLFFNLPKMHNNVLNWQSIRNGLTPGRYQKLIALGYYQWPLDYLIGQFKYGHPQLATVLTEWLLGYALRFQHTRPDCLLPVPISLWRMNRRRYHQTLILAKHLGRYLGIPVIDNWASRKVWQPSQQSLGRRARLDNLNSAYQLKSVPLPSKVAIIDDVVTTGATIATLSGALRKMHPDIQIEVWAIAITPVKADANALIKADLLDTSEAR